MIYLQKNDKNIEIKVYGKYAYISHASYGDRL